MPSRFNFFLSIYMYILRIKVSSFYLTFLFTMPVIGGWVNTLSKLFKPALQEVDSFYHNPLNASEYRVFQIRVLNCTIGVYEGNQPPVLFLEYSEQNPLSIGAVGFFTGFGSGGELEFNTCDIQC